MKKTFLYIFSAVLFFSGCKKDDESIFDKSPDERLNETLASYQSFLTGAPDGWKAFLTPDSGRSATYNFYFKFNSEGRVTMVSEFDSASAATPKESSYRLKALQQPSLLFDTYSYLHVLSDPDATNNGGTYSVGLSSDFEFLFLTATADSISLVGRHHGSRLLLVKATRAEGDAYLTGQLGKSVIFHNISGKRAINISGKIFNYWKRFTINNINYEIDEHSFDPFKRTITFRSFDASGNEHAFTTNYQLTLEGVKFENGLNIGNETITGLTNLNWNSNSNTLTASLIGSSSTINISGANSPLKVDLNAATNWRDKAVANGSYWYNVYGFYINGTFNAHKIASINFTKEDTLYPYYYFIYYPAFGRNYDLLAPIFSNSATNEVELFYGNIIPNTPIRTILKPDGTASFQASIPTPAPPFDFSPTGGPYIDMINQLKSPAGYYLVKTQSSSFNTRESYDMISVADSKIWLTWNGFY